MSWVWEQDIPTTKKMLLLAIADHADDEGNNAWPSKARLAKKISVEAGYVRRLLRELENEGWLTTQTQQGGTLQMAADRRPNLYCINLERGSLQSPPRGSLQSPARGSLQSPLNISNTSSTSSCPKPQAKKKQDLLFEALVEACGLDVTRLTPSARGALNKATSELKSVSAEPEQLLSAARAYKLKYPQAAVTPLALTKHYPALSSAGSVRERNNVLTEAPCTTCEGTGWTHTEGERVVVRCATCRGKGFTGL